MRRLLSKIGTLTRRFADASSAAAAVEFALILPLLLTLYLGAVELSSAISVDKRVSTVSGALGDLVARADSTISTTEVNDYFRAASATMAPYSSSNVKQIVSSVRVNTNGSTQVQWSYAYNGASDHANGTAYTLPADLMKLVTENWTRQGYVIVSEAQMSYLPLFGYFFNNAFSLYHQYFFLPRFGDEISCTGC